MTTDTSALRGELAERAAAAPATTDAKPKTIEDLIRDQTPEIVRALPKHMDADRLARIALTTMRTTPKLLECTQTSLLGALMLSAQVGLEPGPLGHCYLVPRRNKVGNGWVQECTWILGYKGIIELARRSGKVERIEAREVCERDHFDYEYGLNERLEHRPFMGGDRGPIVAFWGLAKFADGGHYFLVMSKAEVDAAKMRSDLGKDDKGPWRDDYPAMGRKTLIRRMAPWLPLSSEHLAMIEQDETVHTEVRPAMYEPPPPTWTTPEVGALPPADADGVPTSPRTEPGPPPAPASSAPAAESPPPPTASDAPRPPVVDAVGPAAGPPPRHPFDPDPEPDEGPMTDDQNNALHKLLRRVRNATGPARFTVLTEVLERPIASMSDLSTTDAAKAIEALNAEQAG